MMMNKDYDYFLVDVFYQENQKNDPFSTRIFLYEIKEKKTPKKRNEADEDYEFISKKSYFESSEPILNNMYSSESIFNPKSFKNKARDSSLSEKYNKNSRMILRRIFTYLSEDPLENPFNNINISIKEENLKKKGISNPTYITLGNF